MKIFERIVKMVMDRLQVSARYRLTYRARVAKVYTGAGATDEFNRPYSADVRILDDAGNPAAAWPLISKAPLPTLWAGAGRGIYAAPAAGQECLVAFAGASPSHPYIAAIFPAAGVPANSQGELIIRHSSGVQIMVAQDKITLTGDELELKAGESGGSILVDGDGILLKGNPLATELDIKGVVTGACTCPYTGAPHAVTSLTVKASL